MKMKTLIIQLEYPDLVSLPEIRQYAKDALENWGCRAGQLPDYNPLYYTTKAPKSKMKPANDARR